MMAGPPTATATLMPRLAAALDPGLGAEAAAAARLLLVGEGERGRAANGSGGLGRAPPHPNLLTAAAGAAVGAGDRCGCCSWLGYRLQFSVAWVAAMAGRGHTQPLPE
jgi:hypothetical protein